jgi:hypothetical protein
VPEKEATDSKSSPFTPVNPPQSPANTDKPPNAAKPPVPSQRISTQDARVTSNVDFNSHPRFEGPVPERSFDGRKSKQYRPEPRRHIPAEQNNELSSISPVPDSTKPPQKPGKSLEHSFPQQKGHGNSSFKVFEIQVSSLYNL